MQVKELKSEGLSRELQVTVPASEIEKHVEARLIEVGKTVKISGFRPGKIPMDMLKKRYGRAVMGEVLESAVNDSTAKALKEKKLRPGAQPKIEVKEFDEGKDLTYTVTVEILPDFDVKDYKGIKIEKPVAKIEDKDIDETLARVTAMNKSSRKIEENRATQAGDVVVIDFHGRTKDDGVEHAGMHAHGHKLKLGSKQFIEGFEDQLIGKKAGEKFEVAVTFPSNYGAKDLAGREAIFDVEIHEIHAETDAVVNDDFAKQLGFEDEKALRDAVRHQLSSDYAQQTRLKMKRQLLDWLDNQHKFEVPKGMVDAELELITRQIEQERKANPDAEALSDDEKQELQMIAERRVRLGLVLAEVGQQHNIQVSDQELQRAVISEAQKYPGQEKMVFDLYQKNPQALEGLRAPLFEEKVVDLMFKDAVITETDVTVEALMADEDDDAEGDKKPKVKKSAKKSAAKSKKSAD